MSESSPEKSNDNSAQPAAAATSIIDEYPYKVFVGNLAFKTTDESLKEFFQAAGEVKVANVIRRGQRSLGYGFVALDSTDAVNKAVVELSKLELDGRPVNVEAARPKEELATERAHRPRRVRNNRLPVSRRRLSDEGEEGTTAEAGEQATGEEPSEEAVGGHDGSARSRTRRYRSRWGGIHQQQHGPPEGGIRRQRRGPPEGEPSTTTIFVTNLPYSVRDADLRNIFKDYEVVSATVVMRHGNSRSKGFGFVEFAGEEVQKRVLAKADGFGSMGRRLTVKVAMSGKRPPEKAEARVDDEAVGTGAQTD